MNANELADLLENHCDVWLPDECVEAPDMLRQLQKERDELKSECDRLYRIIELNGTLK